MKFIVRIKETFIKDVKVEASDKYEAEDYIMDLYSDGLIEVGVDDFDSSCVDYLEEYEGELPAEFIADF